MIKIGIGINNFAGCFESKNYNWVPRSLVIHLTSRCLRVKDRAKVKIPWGFVGEISIIRVVCNIKPLHITVGWKPWCTTNNSKKSRIEDVQLIPTKIRPIRCNIVRLITVEKETIGRTRKEKKETVVRNVKPMIRVQDNPERIESTEEKTGPRLEGDKTGQA